jgi:hypothetical protein
MSILNVNRIQPVGSGQTVTINAANISAGSATVTAGTFSGNLSGNVTGGVTITSGTISGVSTAGITTAYIGSINQSQIGGRRNLIYNGEAMIDQRFSGVSTTFADASYFADRWRCQLSGSVTATVSQSGIGVTTTSDGSFQKSLNVTCTTSSTPSAGHHASIGQRLERTDVSCLGWGTSSALPVTLSFYVRSSKTGIYSISILGGDGANYGYVFEYTISSANTWQKVTKTITGPTVGTWTPGTVTGLYLNFILNNGGSGSAGTLSSLDTWTAGNYYAGSPNNVNFFDTNGATFYLTGVQLEPGPVATPFERRSFGQELALCQRYYEISATNSPGTGASHWSGRVTGSTYARQAVSYKVTKRAIPGTITTVTGDYGTFSSAAPTVNNSTIHGFAWYKLATGTSDDAYLAIDWYSSAEL